MTLHRYIAARYFHTAQAEEEAACIAARFGDTASGQDKAEERVADSRALALSGGGIRSATFNLGLLQSLAEGKRLHEFDYLSTVSGGGYIGGFLGRLFHRAAEELRNADPKAAGEVREPDPKAVAEEVERVLASDESPVIRWLRDNGRYLAPRGGTDTLFALAIYLRNMMAVHLLIGLLLLCTFTAAGWLRGSGLLPPGIVPSLLWLFPAISVTAYVASAWAYWMVHRRGSGANFQTMLALLLGVGACWLLQGFAASAAVGQRLLAWGVAATAILACLIALKARRRHAQAVIARNELSKLSGRWLRLSLIGLALATLDELAYRANELLAGHRDLTLLGAGLTGAMLAALRVLIQKFTVDSGTGGAGITLFGPRLIAVAGLLLLALLALGWAMLAYAVNDAACARLGVFAWPDRSADLFAHCLCSARPVHTLFAAVALLLLALLWYWPRRHLDFLNLSSLHPFYAARLIRAYLGAGNSARDIAWTLKPARRDPAGKPQDDPIPTVSDAHVGDDLSLPGTTEARDRYEPHLRGGPLHLINVTVNQSRFSASGDYQPDRKGWNLAVGPGGYNLGRTYWQAHDWTDAERMTLGRWMSISGAAFSTGAGPRTGTGFSALLGLLGVRLGYWWEAGASEPARASPSLARALFGEFTGRFDPDRERHWYLSDGGHFENTGAYELIRRGVRRIVIADCGADPDYAFEDIANLVQKARVDFNTDIAFLSEAALDAFFAGDTLRDQFFAPAEGIGRHGPNLMLARVDYPDNGPGGWLLAVKPRLPKQLPSDVARHAGLDPTFPQQSTLDQFYDESQWESTRLLGREAGRHLARAMGAVEERWTAWCADTPEDDIRAPWMKASADRPATAATDKPGGGSPGRLLAIYTPVVVALWTGFEFYSNHTKAQATADEARIKAEALQVEEKVKFILSRIDRLDERLGDGSGCGKDGQKCPTAPGQLKIVAEAIDDLQGLRPEKAHMLRELAGRIEGVLKIQRVDADVAPGVTPEPRDEPAQMPAPSVSQDDLLRALVYVQIYDETQRASAQALIGALRRADDQGLALNANQLPGIENVSRSATLRGKPEPQRFARPTLIYYHPEDRVLAQWMASRSEPGKEPGADPLRDADLRDLSRHYPGVRRGVIEIWLPR